MKLIGVTGSCGKTSVCEILYQYLLFKGEAVSMYSSNGNFVNGLTRVKDFFQTTLYHKELNQCLEEDKEGGIEYAIIEITAESVKRNDKVHTLDFDVVALTNFYAGLHNHFDNQNDYFQCKKQVLNLREDKMILIRAEDPNYSLFSDVRHKTYGYGEGVDYRLFVNDNTLAGLDLTYRGVGFSSNLLTAFHARNVSCSLAVLDYLHLLDMDIFSTFARSIFIRGRFEKIDYRDKTIVIDTGLVGSDILLLGLERTLGHQNYKVVYSTLMYADVNEWVKKSRKRNGDYLKRARHIYLTSPSMNDEEEAIFLRDVVGQDFMNYTYAPDLKECIVRAVCDLRDDEVLVVFTRNHYRLVRSILENMQVDYR